MAGLNEDESFHGRPVCLVCISLTSRLGNPMERKAASQYLEQTVRRPTIIHPSDSHNSSVFNISGIDPQGPLSRIIPRVYRVGRTVAGRSGWVDRTKPGSTTPRRQSSCSIQSVRDEAGSWQVYTKILCSSQKRTKCPKGVSRRNGSKKIRRELAQGDD